MLTNSH